MPKYKFTEIAINSTEKKKPTEADKATYIGLEHLDSGTLTVSRWGSDVAPIGEKLIMKKGDILFGKRRAYQKKVGIAPFDGIFSAHGMVLRPHEEVITKEYFPLFISSDYFLDEAIRISVGSLSPTVNWKDLKELEFIIPTIEEQKRITPLVWAAIEAKNAYKTLISEVDNLVKSQFIEMFGDPNTSPNTVPLTEAFIIRDDLRKPLNDAVRSSMHTGELYPYYGANGQVDSINDFITEYNALCLAEDCGAYGPGEASAYIIRGKAWVNNHAHVLVPKDTCNLVYGNELFRLLDITSRINGSTRSKLTQEAMKKLPILLPPKEEQDRFAVFVDQSDKSKFELQQAIQKVDNLIKSLISQE